MTKSNNSSPKKIEKDAYKILLVGGGFFENKGAEAMVLSTRDLLNKFLKNVDLKVATYNSRYSGSHYYNLKIITNKWLAEKPILLTKALIRKIPLMKEIIKDELLVEFENSDVVINLGGFTFHDITSSKGLVISIKGSLVYCSEILLSKISRTPFVIFPQDMGPLKSLIRRFIAGVFIPMSELILLRSEKSKDFLVTIGIGEEKIYVCPDIAFNFTASSKEKAIEILNKNKIDINKRPFVCIVPNIRIYERSFKEMGINNYVIILSKIVDFISNDLNINVLLLPHEFKEDGLDDRKVIDKIFEKVRGKNIFKITEEYSAADLKAIIAQMDVLVVSRYHSAIAGLSSCVPTMVIGWAHKYKTLMGLVGQEDFAIDYQNMDEKKIIDKFNEVWLNKEKIKKNLENKIPELKRAAELPALLIKDLLENKDRHK